MSKSLSPPHPCSKLADDPMIFGQLFYKKKFHHHHDPQLPPVFPTLNFLSQVDFSVARLAKKFKGKRQKVKAEP